MPSATLAPLMICRPVSTSMLVSALSDHGGEGRRAVARDFELIASCIRGSFVTVELSHSLKRHDYNQLVPAI